MVTPIFAVVLVKVRVLGIVNLGVVVVSLGAAVREPKSLEVRVARKEKLDIEGKKKRKMQMRGERLVVAADRRKVLTGWPSS